MSDIESHADEGHRRTSIFDIRFVIAALMAIFGVIILLMGFFGTSDAELERTGGTNINIWTGAGLLVAAGLFTLWGWLRPVVPDEPDESEES